MRSPALFALVVGVMAGVACSVSLGDDKRYSCTQTADCAGDSFICAAPPGGAGFCCKPAGAEKCDKLDNDCNGLIDDGLDATELCNGVDDNCNDRIDEGFSLSSDNANCGRCGLACTGGQSCVQGVCLTRAETDCADGMDNDNNGKIDCAEPFCDMQLCGQGCLCQVLKKAERNCTDGRDNDGDSKIDCGDENCVGAGCGDGGCTCDALRAKETNCSDGRDNDGDTLSDCLDSDCVGVTCQAAPSTFRCLMGQGCACNDGGVVMEQGARCRDNLDNDCDGLVDCAEAACDQGSCALDGGLACKCSGGLRTEGACGDRQDNDGDGTTDCQDNQDCPMGTACTFINNMGMVRNGTCNAMKLCQ